jgi:hypothetical protein
MMFKLLSVFGFGMIGLWEGIPLGFVLRLPPLLIGLFSALGSAAATLLVVVLGKRLRSWLLRHRTPQKEGQKERLIDRIWHRWGIIGLGLLAPCLTGAPLGVALGLFLRAPAGRLLFWLLLGIVLWSALLTGAGVYGSAGVRRLITGPTG